jgi:hypothetical protein
MLPGALLRVLNFAAGGCRTGALSRVEIYARLFAAEWFLWTKLAPVAAVSTKDVPFRLRSRAAALGNSVSHVLGDKAPD